MRRPLLTDPVAVIGPGRVGAALARALFRLGAHIRAVVGSRKEKAERLALEVACDTALDSVQGLPHDVRLVLISTPDDAIQPVAETLSALSLPFDKLFAIHFSGALSSRALAALEQHGARVASVHPVQSFAGRDDDWRRLSGIYYGIEAEDEALRKAEEFVRLLGGVPVRIPPAAKSAYHLACAVASNLTLTLVQAAADLLSVAELSEEEAARLLLPLVEGTVRNIRHLGITGAITGPLARGDVNTVRAHLEFLALRDPDLAQVYKVLGRRAVALGLRRGSFREGRLEEMRNLLRDENSLNENGDSVVEE